MNDKTLGAISLVTKSMNTPSIYFPRISYIYLVKPDVVFDKICEVDVFT